MIPEYGHYALIVALFLSVLLSLLPLYGAWQNDQNLMRSGFSLANGLCACVTVSFLCLAYAFSVDDFSVAYVANNSNLELPAAYKISAVWSAHEGSLLLWVWLLTLWTMAVGIFARKLPEDLISRVLAVMGMVSTGFLAFTIFTSNPFERLLPFPPADGSDLNPLLQDFGLIVHPPTLYLGYVGFSVAFAFAIAALLSGRLDTGWARWTRPWTLVAWVFLTLGIALGSWWAYYELGWGGWWFWDPVENASFMPWLVGTALLHSLAVTEKRGVFKSWTLLLAIFAFSLSLLGTFLVRSGVLTSVHAFAADPTRGYFILMFLAAVIGGSLTLYAIRAPQLKTSAVFEKVSKESLLLFNNFFLIIIMLIVLLGTLFPLIADALDWGKISVGPPYFNLFFIPLMAFLMLLMPIGVMSKWKKAGIMQSSRMLVITAFVCLVMGCLIIKLYAGEFNWQAAMVIALCLWVVLLTIRDVHYQTRHSGSFLVGFLKLSRSYKGMTLAHLGLAMTAAGVCLSSIYSQSLDVRMVPGETVMLGEYSFHFEGAQPVKGENYTTHIGGVTISRGDSVIANLYPEKREYNSDRGNMMTEAGIAAGFFADFYVSMGEALGEGDWAMRLHYKPFVRWVWLGAVLMALGALFSVCDRRYRIKVK